MKLTTKRNRWYFWRELFSYMIPMILIVGTVDVFTSFIKCPLHPEYSAPCSVIWIIAAIYGFFLILTIILAIISAKILRKIKKQIENEFLEAVDNNETDRYIEETPKTTKKVKTNKPKKIIVKSDKKQSSKKATKKTAKNK